MAQKLTKKSKVAVKPVKNISPKRNTSQPKDFISAIGRRKTAVARVRLWKGKEDIVVNDKSISEYFKGEIFKKIYQLPFVVTDTLGQYAGSIKISGSGTKAQIGAFTHGVARVLAKIDPEKYKPVLRAKGFLTRDPRMKETRKVGQGGKARAKKQSPKR